MAGKKKSRISYPRVFSVRDQLVITDRDLAMFYGTRTSRLNQQVKRNPSRFPEDFAFRLTRAEWKCLREERNEPVKRGGQGYLPLVFTELGIGMLVSVLHGRKVAALTIELLRAFARQRKAVEALVADAHAKAQTLFDEVVDAVVMNEDEKALTTPTRVTYFLRGGDDGPIKIGATRNLATRLRSLQLMSPIPLKLLGVVPADIEAECHRVLAPWRIHGEWFQPNRRVLAFIRERCTVKSSEIEC